MARILSFFTVSIISDSPGAGYFYRKIKDARKVLVLDLGFLGDTVQLIPACYRIRQALPEAELHVMVADHIKDVLKLTPWIDKILGYPRFPKSESLLKDLPRVRQLRAARYDAVINVNGSDRSSILTAFTRARHRLGRVPPKVSLFWKWCYTDWVSAPFGKMPVYRARCQCLDKAGFPPFNEEFGVVVPDELKEKARQRVGLDGGYVHVSPFTTLDYKELPLPLLTAFLNRLQAEHPDLKLVLSCAPNDRERGKFGELLAGLDFEPWRTFSGDLSLLEVAAVIAGAKLHLGGDSGAMNLAFMVGTPTFTWFRNYENLVEWMPDGVNHSHVIGEATDEGLQGIGIDELVGTVQDALAKV